MIITWPDVLLICIGGMLVTVFSVAIIYAIHLEVISRIDRNKKTKRLTEEGERILNGSKVLKPEEVCDYREFIEKMKK